MKYPYFRKHPRIKLFNGTSMPKLEEEINQWFAGKTPQMTMNEPQTQVVNGELVIVIPYLIHEKVVPADEPKKETP